MGTIIKSSAVCKDGSLSSIDLAVKAGIDCIEKSGMPINQIELLINIGIYRDDNLMEPAIAPIIQQGIGINSDPTLGNSDNILQSTFSFDLVNGVCGFLYAAEMADAALKTGAARNVLIVSGDTHPSKKRHPAFPYTPIAAAVLLGICDDENRGFRNFSFNTSENGYYGLVSGGDLIEFGKEGRKSLFVKIEDDYTEELTKFAIKNLSNYVKSGYISLNDIAHIIAAEPRTGFGHLLKDSIGLNGYTTVPELYKEHGDLCTSGLAIGYNSLYNRGHLKMNDKVLFIASGSGLTSACAVYQV